MVELAHIFHSDLHNPADACRTNLTPGPVIELSPATFGLSAILKLNKQTTTAKVIGRVLTHYDYCTATETCCFYPALRQFASETPHEWQTSQFSPSVAPERAQHEHGNGA